MIIQTNRSSMNGMYMCEMCNIMCMYCHEMNNHR